MEALIRQLEKDCKEIENTFNDLLERFLSTIEGYKDLSEEGKSIAKIFVCMTILYKFERLKS